jgi:hypothetical protein
MARSCHPEPILVTLSPFANAQGKLREGSRAVDAGMIRCAQHDKGAKQDKGTQTC